MIPFLKVLFSIVFILMCYEVIDTSLHNNLFEQWDFLGSIPWMRATLWDFYANVLAIFCWVCYKETALWKRSLWLILLFCLGSIATMGYLLIKLFSLKKEEGVKELLINRN